MPAWLPKEAKAEWHRAVSRLDDMGILTELDAGPLAMMCCAWAEGQPFAQHPTETYDRFGRPRIVTRAPVG